jgi:hypothetical protein
MEHPLKHAPKRRSHLAGRGGPVPAPEATVCFQQSCPACGRRLLIRVEHLGEQVFCEHCGRGFVAHDAAVDGGAGAESANSILARADRLLAALGRRRWAVAGLWNHGGGDAEFWRGW